MRCPLLRRCLSVSSVPSKRAYFITQESEVALSQCSAETFLVAQQLSMTSLSRNVNGQGREAAAGLIRQHGRRQAWARGDTYLPPHLEM